MKPIRHLLLVTLMLAQALMGLSARPTTGPGDAVSATLAFPMAVKVNMHVDCSPALPHSSSPHSTAASPALWHPDLT
jgi:hypothetical protein